MSTRGSTGGRCQAAEWLVQVAGVRGGAEPGAPQGLVGEVEPDCEGSFCWYAHSL